MLRAIQMMMRNEPMTFYVMLMVIAILIFGAWSRWPTAKKSSAFQTGDLLADVFWLLDKFRVWDRRCLLAHSVGFFRVRGRILEFGDFVWLRTARRTQIC